MLHYCSKLKKKKKKIIGIYKNFISKFHFIQKNCEKLIGRCVKGSRKTAQAVEAKLEISISNKDLKEIYIFLKRLKQNKRKQKHDSKVSNLNTNR